MVSPEYVCADPPCLPRPVSEDRLSPITEEETEAWKAHLPRLAGPVRGSGSICAQVCAAQEPHPQLALALTHARVPPCPPGARGSCERPPDPPTHTALHRPAPAEASEGSRAGVRTPPRLVLNLEL